MAQEYIDVSDNSIYHYDDNYNPDGGSNMLLSFRSIKHLYYSNYDTGSGIITTSGSFVNYEESSLDSTRTMLNDGTGMVFSIPRDLFGTHLEPGSISITSNTYTVTDDGEGNLVEGTNHVGNVIYSHGQLIITQQTYFQHFSQNQDPTISFKSNVPIYTNIYNIKVSDYEFNHTQNATAQRDNTILDYSGSKYLQPSGQYANNVTGSEFQPYITAVGLYNDSNELIAVGKLAQPLPKPADTELTIQVKLDV